MYTLSRAAKKGCSNDVSNQVRFVRYRNYALLDFQGALSDRCNIIKVKE